MRANERRMRLIEELCERKFDTIDNLAFELGVSRRTICYDIEELSLSYPIFTAKGTDGLRSGHTLGISAMPDRPRRNVQVQEGAHGRQEQSGGKGILAEARQVKKEDKRYDEFERRTGFRRERTL